MKRIAAMVALLVATAGCQKAPYHVESILDGRGKSTKAIDVVLEREIDLKDGTGLYVVEGMRPDDPYSLVMKVADGPYAGRIVSIRRSRVGPALPVDP